MLVVYSTLRGIDVSLGKASMVHTSGGIDYGVALRCHLCSIPTLLSSGDHHLVLYTSPSGCGHTMLCPVAALPAVLGWHLSRQVNLGIGVPAHCV